jgi:hypothetical protein
MSDPEKPNLSAGIADAMLKDEEPFAGASNGKPVILVRIAGKASLSGEFTRTGLSDAPDF